VYELLERDVVLVEVGGELYYVVVFVDDVGYFDVDVE